MSDTSERCPKCGYEKLKDVPCTQCRPMTAEQEGPNNPQFDECKFCDDSVGFICEYHSALAEIGRLKAEHERVRKALDELTRHFHPTDGTRFPSPKECSDCKLRAKFKLPQVFLDENFPGHKKALEGGEV